MAIRLPERERSVLRYLGDQVQAGHGGARRPLLFSNEEIMTAAGVLAIDEAAFRQSIGLLDHSGYLQKAVGQNRGLRITLETVGYLAYAEDAITDFQIVRASVEHAIVTTRASNVEVAQALGLPAFQVDLVFHALEEQQLIQTSHVAVGRLVMYIREVSPVLELRHEQAP